MFSLLVLASLGAASCEHPPEQRGVAPPARATAGTKARPPRRQTDRYVWSPNLNVSGAEAGRQRAETALAIDGRGAIWLAYLDADFHQAANGGWVDYPRHVVVTKSTDGGRTFDASTIMTTSGSDAVLATKRDGDVVLAWVELGRAPPHTLDAWTQLVALDEGGGQVGKPIICLPYAPGAMHDQPGVFVARDGTIFAVAVDGRGSNEADERGAAQRTTSPAGRWWRTMFLWRHVQAETVAHHVLVEARPRGDGRPPCFSWRTEYAETVAHHVLVEARCAALDEAAGEDTGTENRQDARITEGAPNFEALALLALRVAPWRSSPQARRSAHAGILSAASAHCGLSNLQRPRN